MPIRRQPQSMAQKTKRAISIMARLSKNRKLLAELTKQRTNELSLAEYHHRTAHFMERPGMVMNEALKKGGKLKTPKAKALLKASRRNTYQARLLGDEIKRIQRKGPTTVKEALDQIKGKRK